MGGHSRYTFWRRWGPFFFGGLGRRPPHHLKASFGARFRSHKFRSQATRLLRSVFASLNTRSKTCSSGDSLLRYTKATHVQLFLGVLPPYCRFPPLGVWIRLQVFARMQTPWPGASLTPAASEKRRLARQGIPSAATNCAASKTPHRPDARPGGIVPRPMIPTHSVAATPSVTHPTTFPKTPSKKLKQAAHGLPAYQNTPPSNA